MKLFLPLAGAALLLIAATASFMKMSSPAPAATPPPSLLATKKVRKQEAPAVASDVPVSETAALPQAAAPAETISRGRRTTSIGETVASSKPRSDPQQAMIDHRAAILAQRPGTMPMAYQIDEATVAAEYPDVPAEALSSIKDDFENEIGLDQEDTASPEYARRWQSAELMAAARLRARYGWAAYAGMQKQAVLGK